MLSVLRGGQKGEDWLKMFLYIPTYSRKIIIWNFKWVSCSLSLLFSHFNKWKEEVLYRSFLLDLTENQLFDESQ